MASRCKIIVVKLINFQKVSSYTIIVEPLVRRRPPPHRHYCLDLRLLLGFDGYYYTAAKCILFPESAVPLTLLFLEERSPQTVG
ncbi:hypothetical protein CDAR_269981 [Caerostris darwini]|uniref:Uncharacterized protein n=1 Tax=Caerostris darwini TaxID=1538125 RepID=A0AAV4RQ14_9ARAC|nr:hypothetical protein CDAR_269981 [Caerostris darwini]